jgi:hypothetical protein
MSTPTYSLDFVSPSSASPASSAHAGLPSRALKRAWGLVCGATFLATRASIYLVVLPFVALASLAGTALYAVQALIGPHRG